ncbi:StfH/YfcO family fimbrial adhesin [Enterobacter cancerogenus]|uniref:StfH/YfcO family fimbrial adhesin n=1 Tax=Enterobacter cancerogenus TaxID=69218 RepID=UPI0030764A6F
MKRLSALFILFSLMLVVLVPSSAMASINNLKSQTHFLVYFAYLKNPNVQANIQLHVAFPSSSSSENGIYDATDAIERGLGTPTLIYWSSASIPSVEILHAQKHDIDSSHCPGIDTTLWACGSADVAYTQHFEYHQCPWNIAQYTVSVDPSTGKSWTSPPTRETACPTVPVATYDISWSKDNVQHEKQLILTPNGGRVETTLKTYLMEGGRLCDGSLMNDRGVHCRYVSTGVSVTVLGCDDPRVTTSISKHPMTDIELYDIRVQADTQHLGAGLFSTTCNFRYLIDEL